MPQRISFTELDPQVINGPISLDSDSLVSSGPACGDGLQRLDLLTSNDKPQGTDPNASSSSSRRPSAALLFLRPSRVSPQHNVHNDAEKAG
ncbi:hypothetical protein EYF80_042084 [Liparis tanakae]|uniref:Uncharacterized protein n=1 Tax=Liparis tanakae TaxID=230148 RepID=A0A4Z2G2G8_9TELE|nr:hypothetical protein EYF80_042084 [Liparis tanakae]